MDVIHAHTHKHAVMLTCLLADTGRRKLPIAAVAKMRMVLLRLDSNCRRMKESTTKQEDTEKV